MEARGPKPKTLHSIRSLPLNKRGRRPWQKHQRAQQKMRHPSRIRLSIRLRLNQDL